MLELLIAGNPPKKAASIMGVERQTAITCLYRAKAKLGAKTSFQAIAIFTRQKVKEEI